MTTEFRLDFPESSQLPIEGMAVATVLHEQTDVLEAQLAETYRVDFSSLVARSGLEVDIPSPQVECSLHQADNAFALVVIVRLSVDEAEFATLSALAWRDTFTLASARLIKVVTGSFLQAQLGIGIRIEAECTGVGGTR